MRTTILALLTLGAACSKHEAGPDGGATVPPVVGAQVAAATAQKYLETVDAVGTVTTRAGHVASLAAPAPTRVAKVFVTVGDRVRAGDALVAFEAAPFDAAARSAEAALTAAERGADRAQRLAEAGVLPRKEADAANTDLAVARANALTARRSRELATLRAPIAGVVTRMSAVLGANADPSQPMVEVADPSMLDVMLTLSPTDAMRVHRGQRVALYAGAQASGDAVATGTVEDVSGAVDTTSRGVATRVAVSPEAPSLRLGQTLFGRITVLEHPTAVMVPIEALVPADEGFRVFVVDSAGIAHATPVVLGARGDRLAWIKEGVKAGDHVVTRGAYGVDDGARVMTAKP